MKRVLAGCLALLILSAGVAHAVSDTDKQAAKIFNKALDDVSKRAVCQPKAPSPATLIHDPPSQDLLSLFSVLRRPASPADAVSPQRLTQVPFIQSVFVDYVRVAHTVDGRSYEIVPARIGSPLPPASAACLHAVHEHLLHLLRGKPRGVRRRALGFFKAFVDLQHQVANAPPTETVFLFHHRAGPLAGGGGNTIDEIRRRGEWGFVRTRSGGTIVDGLLPDPVASVTTYYSRGVHRTDMVRDNMVSFVVPHDVPAVSPVKMIWRAADGSVVRAVHFGR
jgi:hypothetical protein